MGTDSDIMICMKTSPESKLLLLYVWEQMEMLETTLDVVCSFTVGVFGREREEGDESMTFFLYTCWPDQV